MQFSKFFDDYDKFRSEADIRSAIATSKNYGGEDVSKARLFKFFDTSKQRSYLIATVQKVYCLVDDIRENEPRVIWSEDIAKLTGIALEIYDKTDRTGLVDFGSKHKNWLFTKAMFPNNDIASRFNDFVSSSTEN
ncbi:MAG: hypothetical protein O2971_08555 [Proteobacteria bacterium]|nr:hypothetical protein [Pseudomonadota bacterium]